MRISDWSSDVCSSDLLGIAKAGALAPLDRGSSWPVRRYYERTAAWKRDVSVDGYLDRHRGNEQQTLMAGLLARLANCLYLDSFLTAGWILFFPPVIRRKIGRASCRERGCQYVSRSGGA